MGFFDAVRELFRDHTRDNLCAELQTLGVNARMADRGRPEEDTGEGTSLGIIDIVGGSIPWVNVRKVTTSGGGYEDGDDSVTTCYTDYGVPVGYPTPNVTIKSARRKGFPLLGAVIDAEWSAEGSNPDAGVVADILRRLGEDATVRDAIMATRDVKIIVGPHGPQREGRLGWVISTQTRAVPTRQAWDCYQAIARHLIEAGREEPRTD